MSRAGNPSRPQALRSPLLPRTQLQGQEDRGQRPQPGVQAEAPPLPSAPGPVPASTRPAAPGVQAALRAPRLALCPPLLNRPVYPAWDTPRDLSTPALRQTASVFASLHPEALFLPGGRVQPTAQSTDVSPGARPPPQSLTGSPPGQREQRPPGARPSSKRLSGQRGNWLPRSNGRGLPPTSDVDTAPVTQCREPPVTKPALAQPSPGGPLPDPGP